MLARGIRKRWVEQWLCVALMRGAMGEVQACLSYASAVLKAERIFPLRDART